MGTKSATWLVGEERRVCLAPKMSRPQERERERWSDRWLRPVCGVSGPLEDIQSEMNERGTGELAEILADNVDSLP